MANPIGKPTAIDCRVDNKSLRRLHGLVIDSNYVDEIKGTGYVYRLTLGPSSYFHEQGCAYRIFQPPKYNSVLDIIKKVLESAIANAEHNDGADIDELRVKTIYVEQGATLKRFAARAKGRGLLG